MRDTNSYITINLDLKGPVEIGGLSAMFAGFGTQFETYLANEHPTIKGQAKLYVREVRKGSIVADFIVKIPELIVYMDVTLLSLLLVLCLAKIFVG